MVIRIHCEQPALHEAHTRATELSKHMAQYHYAVCTVAELITNFKSSLL